MRIAPLRWLPLSSLALLLLSSPQVARADISKDQCIEANRQGQSLRREGKLLLAAEQLRACAQPACPAILRDDCNKRLDDLISAQPSLILDVRDAAGGDLADVTVTMDGKVLLTQLTGTPIAVDPGKHDFTFSAANQGTAARTLVFAEGTGTRHVEVVLGNGAAAAKPSMAEPAKTPTGDSPREHGMSTKNIVGITLGAAGVASIGVGSALGLMAISQNNTANRDCSMSSCPNRSAASQAHSSAVSESTVSTVTFIAGGALVATGITMLLLNGSADHAEHANALIVAPSVGPSSGGIFVRGEF